MKPPGIRGAVSLAADVILLLLCVLHLPSIVARPRVPFEADVIDGSVQVTRILDAEAAGSLAVGHRLSRWGEDSIAWDHDLEFLGDFHSIGEKVTLTLRPDDRPLAITLIPYYEPWYVVIVFLVGLVTWGVGVFVLLVRPGELAASTLHWSLVCMGVVTILSWGQTPEGSTLALLARGVFFIVYMGVASIFFLFTTLFPRPSAGSLVLKLSAAFLPGVVLLALLLPTHLTALHDHSLARFQTFHQWYDVFHVVKLIYVAAGILLIVRSYWRAETSVERTQLQWIIWGLAIGPTPFLVLITIPELFAPSGLVPEVVTLLFLVIIPIAFAISIVKYRALDIEVVIKRTTVYAVVLGAVLGVYITLVAAVSAWLGSFVREASVVAAVVIAVLFEPVRRLVQRVVDRKFFRVQYDFRETGRRFLADIEHAVDENDLTTLVVRRTGDVIPVERMGVFVFTSPAQRLLLLGHQGFDALAGRGVPFAWESLKTSLHLPVAIDGVVEPGVETEVADPAVFRRWGMAVVFPIVGEKESILGFIVLGPKKSGARFTAEDIDLMMQVAAETGLALERIVLHRRLLLEQAESRRLDELNKLKSDFVSYVSHELRTPLTSIKMFTEMLGAPSLRLGQKARAHVRIIEGEAERLGRMVSTILDSARIEQGVQEYHLVETDLVPLVRKAMAAMAYQLEQGRFAVTLLVPKRTVMVLADADAVTQAVTNLVANAVKYSAERKSLTVRLTRRRQVARIRVTDRGIGIPPESLPHLFERFYRDPAIQRKVQGVGLGLPLVKHVMDAHGGRIEIMSTPGKGTTCMLSFPVFHRRAQKRTITIKTMA